MDLCRDYNTINHLNLEKKKLQLKIFRSELKESSFIQNYSDVH